MTLHIADIHKSFDTQEVLRGATYSFVRGKIYGLLGRNGSGKTTLFNCIAEDLPYEKGTVTLEQDGVQLPAATDDIGYVLSTPVVPEFLTAREFLKFFIDINQPTLTNPKAIDEYFELMRIKDSDRDKLMKDYSHGMKNKMQLLVNFLINPKVLLLDEPLTSFDVVVADEMKQLLRDMKKDRVIILSTHIMELATDLCDEIVVLHSGILTQIPKDGDGEDAYKHAILRALKEDVDA